VVESFTFSDPDRLGDIVVGDVEICDSSLTIVSATVGALEIRTDPNRLQIVVEIPTEEGDSTR